MLLMAVMGAIQNSLVEVCFVWPSAKHGSEGVVQVFGKANVLQLFAVIVHCKDSCLAPSRHQGLNETLQLRAKSCDFNHCL